MRQWRRVGETLARHQWWLPVLAALLAVAAALLPGPVPVLGNLHDIFIPLNAAAAIEHGLALHDDIRSPFGHLYFWLHHAASRLWQLLAPDASALAVLTLAGLLFALGAVLALAFARCVLGPNPLTRPWLAALLILLAVSPRNQASLDDHKTLLWYGLYNNQLWGVVIVLLAVLLVLLTHTGTRETLRARPTRQLALAVLLAAGLYVTLHYKVNFFLACTLLALAILLVTGGRAARRIAIATAVLMLLAVLVTGIAGYDYPGYAADLARAAAAKRQHPSSAGSILATIALVALLATALIANGGAWRAHATAERHVLVLVPSLLAALAIALGVLGDFSGARSRFWLLPALAALAVPAWRPLRRVAILFIAMLMLLDAFAIARTIELRYRDDHERFVRVTMSGGPGRTIDLLLEPPDRRAARIFRHLADATPEALIGIASFSPSLGLSQDPNNWNIHYARARAAAARWLRERASALVAGEAEFVNGVAWLNGRAPAPGPHWVHAGTTLPAAALPRLWAWYAQWDVVLVPVFSVDALEQVALACNFFRFNRRVGYPFELVEVTPHWLAFVKKENSETLRNPALKPWREYDRTIAQGNCRARAQSIW